MDKLVQISPDDWIELRDLFKSNWPVNELPFNTIQNYIKWIRIDPKIKHLEILSLNGSWRENGTFIIMDRYELYFFSLEETNDSLLRALKLIDWDYSYRICAILDRHLVALDAIFETIPESCPSYNHTNVFHFAKEDAKHLTVVPPEGFRLDTIGSHLANQINSAWRFRCVGSEYGIKRLLTWNASVGLFNEANELVAWAMHSNIGLVAYLHVNERYRRRGFGELILKAIAKRLAEQGLNAYGTVSPKNAPSRGLFEKTGYKMAQHVSWIRNHSRKLVEWEFAPQSLY